MSEKRREVKNLKGDPIRDYPPTRLVTRPRRGPGGIIIGETIEVENDPMEVITLPRAPSREIEPEVKGEPTHSALVGHRAVDARSWGVFAQPGKQTIVGGKIPQPMIRNPGAYTGNVISVATRAETVSEAGLLRRTLERLLGEKDK